MKAVFSYIIVLLSAAAYMVLFDRNAGGIMTVFLIVVPLVSVFLTLFSRKRVKLSIESDDDLVRKNKECTIKVCVTKNTILPLPVISFEFRATEHFRKPDYDVYRFSMSENRNLDFDIKVFPVICGKASVKIGHMYITDYLGIFRFKMPFPQTEHEIDIIPEIHEITDCSEILRSISDTLPDNDDDETETSAVYGRAAFPGYGYRNYVPGDSLKKVNWKLSSKKNELYVRMDESAGITLPKVILDLSAPENGVGKHHEISDIGLITEGALSILDMCVRNGIECTFICPGRDEVIAEDVVSREDIERIACEIIKHLDTGNRLPDLSSAPGSKSSDMNIVCTLGIYDRLAEEAGNSVLAGNHVKFVIPEYLYIDDSIPVPELWLLEENWQLSRTV